MEILVVQSSSQISVNLHLTIEQTRFQFELPRLPMVWSSVRCVERRDWMNRKKSVSYNGAKDVPRDQQIGIPAMKNKIP